MKKINVGFPIELEILIESRMLIQANSGGGKSYLIRKLIEEIHGKVPLIVLDLEGEFVSIREKYDVIILGKGHDIPINIQYADKLARYLLELRASAIIDLSELMQHERILFVRRFLESMMNAPKTLWNPTAVFIDEAHIFCPEDSKAESGASVIDLCTRGRKRGYCAILATQRISKLRKDAVAELNNKIIGRTGLDVDVKRTAFELGMSSNDAQKMLPHLESGEFYVFGPAISRSVKKEKVSKANTTHIRKGTKLTKVIPPSNAIQKLIGKIADIPKEVEKEKDLVKNLQEENRTLKAELKNQKPVSIPVKNNEEVVELKKNLTSAKKTIDEYERRDAKIRTGIGQNIKSLNALMGMPEIKLPEIKVRTIIERPKVVIRHTPIQGVERSVSDNSLGRCEKSILTVLAQRQGNKSSKSQLGILSGYSPNSGGFNNSLSKLRSFGFLSGNGEGIVITDDGLQNAGEFEPLPTGGDLHRYWYGKLPKCEATILKFLIESHPAEISKEEIGNATKYSSSSGGFNNALSKLRTLELISGYGSFKASDSLFE